jgi:hypothetical protein
MRALGLMVAVVVTGCGGGSRPALSAGAPAHGGSPDDQLVDAVTDALHREAWAEAAAVIDRARQAAGDAQPGAENLAYYDATVHAYQGDFRGAAAIMRQYAAKVDASEQAAFTFHDAMIALRTADGDLQGALVECEEMVRVGSVGTWDPADRSTFVQLKQYWHRAYLLRMSAQTRTGADRQAFIDYAERARQDYIAIAAPVKSLADSIAVLDAYFAFCDGDRTKMRLAAAQVDVAADDDVEDLYLVQLAFEGAGDHDDAVAVRKRMAALSSVTVITPVFQAWMRADAAPADQPHAFSPMYPAGARKAP